MMRQKAVQNRTVHIRTVQTRTVQTSLNVVTRVRQHECCFTGSQWQTQYHSQKYQNQAMTHDNIHTYTCIHIHKHTYTLLHLVLVLLPTMTRKTKRVTEEIEGRREKVRRERMKQSME